MFFLSLQKRSKVEKKAKAEKEATLLFCCPHRIGYGSSFSRNKEENMVLPPGPRELQPITDKCSSILYLWKYMFVAWNATFYLECNLRVNGCTLKLAGIVLAGVVYSWTHGCSFVSRSRLWPGVLICQLHHFLDKKVLATVPRTLVTS